MIPQSIRKEVCDPSIFNVVMRFSKTKDILGSFVVFCLLKAPWLPFCAYEYMRRNFVSRHVSALPSRQYLCINCVKFSSGNCKQTQPNAWGEEKFTDMSQ